MAELLGQAVLELSTDSTQLDQGLKSAREHAKELGATMKKAGGAVTAFGAPFAALGYAALQTGDDLDKMSQRLGMSVETLSALSRAADLGGASIEDVVRAVTAMYRQLGDLDNITGEATTALENLGLTADDLRGKTPTEQFFTLAGALAEVEDTSLRNSAALNIFGRSGLSLIPMLDSLTQGNEALVKQTAEMGRLWSEDAAVAAASFNDAVSELTGAIGGLAVKFLESGLLDHITDLITRMAQAVGQFSQAHPVIAQVTMVIGLLAAAIGPLLVALGLMLPAITALGAPILAIFGAGGAIAAAIGTVIAFGESNNETVKAIGNIWETCKRELKKIFDAIERVIESATKAWDRIMSLWGDDMQVSWSRQWEAVRKILEAVVQALGGILEGGLKVLSGLIVTFTGLISGDWGTFADGLRETWDGLWGILRSIGEAGGRILAEVVKLAWDSILQYWSWAQDKLRETWDGLWGILRSIGEAGGRILAEVVKLAWDSILQYWSWAQDKAADTLRTFTADVQRVWTAMWDAIKRAIEAPITWVQDKVGGFADEVVGTFKGLFDRVVGHSIIPDMMSAISAEFGRLGSEVLPQVGRDVGGIGDIFGGLGDTIGSLLSDKMGLGALMRSLGDLSPLKFPGLSGIVDVFGEIGSAVSSAVGKVANFAGSLANIASGGLISGIGGFLGGAIGGLFGGLFGGGVPKGIDTNVFLIKEMLAHHLGAPGTPQILWVQRQHLQAIQERLGGPGELMWGTLTSARSVLRIEPLVGSAVHNLARLAEREWAVNVNVQVVNEVT